MEKYTYADALGRWKETGSKEIFEGKEKSSTLVSDIEDPDPKTPHVVFQSHTESNEEPSVRIGEIVAEEVIEAVSEDLTPPSQSLNRASSPEELYYLHQVLELYHRSMKTIHAWLTWEGYGSPGNTAQPTSRLLKLAEQARWRDAMPTAREMWALEVAIDCARIVQMVDEGEGESKNWQCTSKTSAVAM